MKDDQTINPYQKQAPHHCEWPAECSWEWCDSSWFPATTSADSAVATLKATSNTSACLHGVSSKFQDLRANILNDTGQIDTPGAKRLVRLLLFQVESRVRISKQFSTLAYKMPKPWSWWTLWTQWFGEKIMRPVRIFLHAWVCWGALELLLMDDGLQWITADCWGLTAKSTQILWPGSFLHSRCPSTFVESWRLESLAHWPLTLPKPGCFALSKKGDKQDSQTETSLCFHAAALSQFKLGEVTSHLWKWRFHTKPTEPSFDCQLQLSSWFAVPCVRTLGRPLQQVPFSQVLRSMENKRIQTPSNEYCAAHVGKVVLTSACHHTPCHLALPPLALLAHLRDPLSRWWVASTPTSTDTSRFHVLLFCHISRDNVLLKNVPKKWKEFVTPCHWFQVTRKTNTDTMMLNNVTLWFTLGGRWKASENVMMQYHGWR